MEQSSTCNSIANISLKKKIYDGEYFEILDQENDMLVVRCTSCPPSLQLRASIRSNGNIIKHIQRRHPELLSKIRVEKNLKSRATRHTCSAESPTSQGTPKIIKHTTIKNESLNMYENSYSGHNIDKFAESHQNANDPIHLTDSMQHNESIEKLANSVVHRNLSNSTTSTRNLLDHAIAQATEEEYLVESDVEDNFDISTSCIAGVGVGAAIGGTTERIGTASSSTGKHWTAPDKVNPMVNQEIISLQKELMLREFEELQDMRRQKHRYEIEILRQDLEFKKIEHRKKIELLDKKLKG